jgi:hypothetical protein
MSSNLTSTLKIVFVKSVILEEVSVNGHQVVA